MIQEALRLVRWRSGLVSTFKSRERLTAIVGLCTAVYTLARVSLWLQFILELHNVIEYIRLLYFGYWKSH